MNPLWSYALAAVGVTGLLIARRRPRVGWWFNLAAQAAWITYALATRQWGFLLSAGAYAVAYALLLREVYRYPDAPPRYPTLPGRDLYAALVDVGIVRTGERIRRVVIDAHAGRPVALHIERLGDARLLDVVGTLEGAEIRNAHNTESEAPAHE